MDEKEIGGKIGGRLELIGNLTQYKPFPLPKCIIGVQRKQSRAGLNIYYDVHFTSLNITLLGPKKVHLL